MMFTQTLEGMNKFKLRSACREHSVKGYSKLTVDKMRAALAQITTAAEMNREPEHEDCCPLCGGDPTSQTWATEGKTCFCRECGKTWSVKTRKEVRTGYKRNGAAAPCKVEKDREERNGIKRPSAGGACDAVWRWLDKNPAATIAEVRAMAEKKGLNPGNSQEIYAWRRFNGITGRVKK